MSAVRAPTGISRSTMTVSAFFLCTPVLDAPLGWDCIAADTAWAGERLVRRIGARLGERSSTNIAGSSALAVAAVVVSGVDYTRVGAWAEFGFKGLLVWPIAPVDFVPVISTSFWETLSANL